MIARQSVSKNSLMLLGSTIIQKALTLLYFVVIARSFGPLDQGRYSTALAFTTLFAVLIDLGLSSALTRETARDPERAAENTGQMYVLRIYFGIVVYGLILLMAFLLHYPFALIHLIVFAGLAAAIDVATTSSWAVVRGYQNLSYESIGGIIAILLMISVGSITAFLHWPVVYLIYAVLLGSIGHCLFALWVIGARLKLRLSLKPKRETIRRLLFISLPFAGAAIFSRIYTFSDTAIVAKMAGEDAAGYYAAANKLVLALNMIPASLSASIYPAMSSFHEQLPEHIGQLLQRAAVYLGLLACPIAISMVILAPDIIHFLYGATYTPTILALQYLAPAVFFGFLSYPLGSVLAATDRQHLNTLIFGVGAAVSIAVNLVLVGAIGHAGAALGASITYAVMVMLSLFFTRHVWKERWLSLLMSFAGVCIAGCGMAGVYYLSDGISFFCRLIMGGLVYTLLIFIFRVVTWEDLVRLARRSL